MIKHGRKRARIYEYRLECGENVVRRDVDNIVEKYKAELAGDSDDDDSCAAALAEFVTGEGNVVTLDEISSRFSGVISMSSRHMRDMPARFPELILVDCTHKTHRYVMPMYCPSIECVLTFACVLLLYRYNYQLCTVMVVDENGHGQPVQHSLREGNADWHMSRGLEHLIRVNPEAADAVQVIMVDKDLNEIRVLQSYSPKARELICMFHVIKYLKVASQAGVRETVIRRPRCDRRARPQHGICNQC
jgi:hypothetical protein